MTTMKEVILLGHTIVQKYTCSAVIHDLLSLEMCSDAEKIPTDAVSIAHVPSQMVLTLSQRPELSAHGLTSCKTISCNYHMTSPAIT